MAASGELAGSRLGGKGSVSSPGGGSNSDPLSAKVGAISKTPPIATARRAVRIVILPASIGKSVDVPSSLV